MGSLETITEGNAPDLLRDARNHPILGKRVLSVITEKFDYGATVGVCLTIQDDATRWKRWAYRLPAGQENASLNNCLARANRYYCGVVGDWTVSGNEPMCEHCGHQGNE